MITPSAKRMVHTAQERTAERTQGTARQSLRLSAARAAELQIPNLARLPVKPGAALLQNSDGSFVSIPGYNT